MTIKNLFIAALLTCSLFQNAFAGRHQQGGARKLSKRQLRRQRAQDAAHAPKNKAAAAAARAAVDAYLTEAQGAVTVKGVVMPAYLLEPGSDDDAANSNTSD